MLNIVRECWLPHSQSFEILTDCPAETILFTASVVGLQSDYDRVKSYL